jgi:hypothetical protein
MAKNPGKGRCVHCLKDVPERNWDHVFPKSWYPDTTPQNLEKWQIPSCIRCNRKYGKIEEDLIGRFAVALDSKNPASAGLVETAIRAIDPAAGRDDRDAVARLAKQRKFLAAMYKGEEIADAQVMPGLGERWGRPLAQQLAIKIPGEKLMAMTRKIVRGHVYLDNKTFIVPPYKIECYLAEDEKVKVVKELLDKHGKEYKREPGLVIRRAPVEGDPLTALYEITFWDQFRTYAIVSTGEALPRLSPRQRRALKRAQLNAWLQRRARKQGRPKARARSRARKRARRTRS